jgi:SAM-dependent methyltransferase
VYASNIVEIARYYTEELSNPVYRLKESPYSSHSLLLELFPPTEQQERVLDVGCGDGYLSALLVARGYDVTGVERSGGTTDRFPRDVILVEADLEEGLPTLSQTYDHVVCADILEHLRRPDSILRSLADVLKPGGRLVASLPNSGNVYFRANVAAGRFPQHEKGLFDRTHLRFYTWAGWRELMRMTGWRITSVVPSAIPVGMVVPPAYENSWAVRVAESVCYGLARIRKTLFAYQFIVVAVRD